VGNELVGMNCAIRSDPTGQSLPGPSNQFVFSMPNPVSKVELGALANSRSPSAQVVRGKTHQL
jgi:hypothetical protein